MCLKRGGVGVFRVDAAEKMAYRTQNYISHS